MKYQALRPHFFSGWVEVVGWVGGVVVCWGWVVVVRWMGLWVGGVVVCWGWVSWSVVGVGGGRVVGWWCGN